MDPDKPSCWKGYKATGTKMKGGKKVPDCKKEEVEVVDEKISASGYARAKKWREDQAAKKDRDDNAKWEEKARTHKWDGKTWNKRDKPTHEKGTGPHAKKAAAANESIELQVDEGIGDMAIKAIEKTNPPHISKRSDMMRKIKLKQLKSYLKKQDEKKKKAKIT